jgi:predicted nuclease of predicted toxin-antitoxin system
VKLLLDEMWSPAVAEQLRTRGHDVAAVAERLDLRTKPDETVFAAALSEDRVIVTEDVADFRVLAENEALAGRFHPGLVFTTSRVFPRAERNLGQVIRALAALLDSEIDLRNREHWLLPT